MLTAHLDHVQRAVIVELIIRKAARLPCDRDLIIAELKGEFELPGEWTSAFSRIERKVNRDDISEAIDELIESDWVKLQGNRLIIKSSQELAQTVQ